MTNISVDLSTTENPDLSAIRSKGIIDITLAEFDVSASLSSGSLSLDSVMLNHSNQKIVIIDDNDSASGGDVYFTPIYAEKINYSQWKLQVDKTFKELKI